MKGRLWGVALTQTLRHIVGEAFQDMSHAAEVTLNLEKLVLILGQTALKGREDLKELFMVYPAGSCEHHDKA